MHVVYSNTAHGIYFSRKLYCSEPNKAFAQAGCTRLGQAPIRNKEMVEYADAVLLYPGGKGAALMKTLALLFTLGEMIRLGF